MDINAERINFPHPDVTLRVGQTLWEEPYVKLCIQDGVTDGTGPTSLVVDIVPYTKATALAAGYTEEQAAAAAAQRYMEALLTHDIDGFEAEMFWESYQDTEFVRANPYALEQDNPYIETGRPSSPDEGWGPRNQMRTPSADPFDD